MTRTVYTNYWVNERVDVRKKHGSYNSEKEAVHAVFAWWEIHNEVYNDIEYNRTNTGALEIIYGDPNYYYRVEEEKVSSPLPKTSYKVKSQGEIDALRQKHQLNSETFVFDELPEPYRDRLIVAMADIVEARKYTYTENGRPIVKTFEKKQQV